MSKEKEVLRLLGLGLSQRSIMKATKVSSHFVMKVRKYCLENNLTYEEAYALEDSLIPKKRKESSPRGAKRPNCKYVHDELKKKGVTLKLLHDEYVQECIVTGEEYLKYTQFCNVYKGYVETNELTMHIERKPGERMALPKDRAILSLRHRCFFH